MMPAAMSVRKPLLRQRFPHTVVSGALRRAGPRAGAGNALLSARARWVPPGAYRVAAARAARITSAPAGVPASLSNDP